MKLKWLNYFKFTPDIYLVAFIFDHRVNNKFDFLKDILETYYSLLELENEDDIIVL